MMTHEQTKQQIVLLLDTLPMDRLEEVANFVEFLRMKYSPSSTYVPVRLGGILSDTLISEDDLTEVRQEMWRSLGERDL